MNKISLIRKELEKLGIKNEAELQKAIQDLPPLNLYMIAEKEFRKTA